MKKWLFIFVVAIAVNCVAQSVPFRFAWLSDTHVGSTTGAEDLRASVRDINAMEGIAFTILCGDITELGRNVELRLAKSILDSLKTPYYIIPGNHDTKWSESGCTQFSKLFGADRFVFESGGFRFIGLHEGPVMRMGDGHFAPEDIRWLDSVLINLPEKNQPVIFVTHYPLDEGIDNWYEASDRLRKVNIKAVFVGHGHSNRAYNFEGIPATMGRSNLRAGKPTGGFTIVDITSDTLYCAERLTGKETKPVWRKIPLSGRITAVDSVHRPRPDFSINGKYPEVNKIWSYRSPFTIASAPGISKDDVVFGNSSGEVTCLSITDGSKRWSFQTGSTVYSSPVIANGKVIFGSSDGKVYCLSMVDGSFCWKFAAAAPVVAVPLIDNGVVYCGGGDGAFRAFDLETGKVKWEFGGVNAFVESKPLLYGSKIIFGSWDTYLYALNIHDGSLAWRWSNGTGALGLSPAACWPVGADGKVFIVAPDRAITAIDVRTGKTSWRSNRHQVREAIGLSLDEKRVYAKCMNDTLFAFSSLSSDEQLLWATPCGYGYDIDPSMPMEKEGAVFFGTKNGLVYSLDAASGTIRWVHKMGVTIVNTVAPVNGDRVVATDFDGSVMLIGR
jgi:outer membrane protein assembly factor BamB/predicted phosphodiesterase